MMETGIFYIKLYMSICTRENSSRIAQVFFFARISLSFLLDTMTFFNIETKLKAKNFTTHKRGISLNAHIVTQMYEVN